MPEIEIYTQPWCPYCARAVNLLTRKGVTFREIDAPHGSPQRAESIRRADGRSSVPQIFIAGRHIGDCDAPVTLDAKGAPAVVPIAWTDGDRDQAWFRFPSGRPLAAPPGQAYPSAALGIPGHHGDENP